VLELGREEGSRLLFKMDSKSKIISNRKIGKDKSIKLFGRMLKEYRNKSCLSQEQLGNEIGMSQSYINMIERGRRSLKPEKVESFIKLLDFKEIEAEKFRMAGLGIWYSAGEIPLLNPEGFGRELSESNYTWIIGESPMEFQTVWNSVYNGIYKNIKMGGKFTYWLSKDSKKDFDRFLKTIKDDLRKKDRIPPQRGERSMECILCESEFPLIFDLVNLYIYNPLSDSRVGRQKIYGQNENVRFIPMPKWQIDSICEGLLPIFDRVLMGSELPQAGAKFSRYYPK